MTKTKTDNPVHISAASIGQKIKEAREQIGQTQQELGAKVFKTGAAIGYIERGQRGLSVDDLITFSKALNVPIKYFFQSQTSETILLQETLYKLQQHIKSLNSTLQEQQQEIKTITDSLPRSEELRLITQSSLDPIILVDKSAKIVYATKSIFELTGIHFSKIINLSLNDLRAESDSPSYEEFVAKVFEKKKIYNYKTRFKHLTGKIIDVELNAQLIKKNDEPIVHAVIRDVTLRNKIQHQLEQSQRKYYQVIEQSKDGFYLVDQSGSVVEWNSVIAKQSGISKKEAIGQKIWNIGYQLKILNLNRKQLQEVMQQNINKMLRQRKSLNHSVFSEVKIIDPAGQTLVFNNHSFPVFTKDEKFVAAILHDITFEKIAKDESRFFGERWRLILDDIPVMLAAVSPEKKLALWNNHCETVTGFSYKELMDDQDWLIRIFPNVQYLGKLLNQWSQQKNQFKNWTMKLTCKDGQQKTILWTNISFKYKIPEWEAWLMGQVVE